MTGTLPETRIDENRVGRSCGYAPRVDDPTTALAVTDWRRRVFALYAEVRDQSTSDPAGAHDHWRRVRDDLFANHPASPLLPADRPGFGGLPVSAYDRAWRFTAAVEPPAEPLRIEAETGTDGIVPFELLGRVTLSGIGTLDVWRLASYGGGLFLPVKDLLATEDDGTYSGGRYLLDTVKGADLGPGERPNEVVIDFNFAYNPSCAYDPAWACPLAPPGNHVDIAIPVGERV